ATTRELGPGKAQGMSCGRHVRSSCPPDRPAGHTAIRRSRRRHSWLFHDDGSGPASPGPAAQARRTAGARLRYGEADARESSGAERARPARPGQEDRVMAEAVIVSTARTPIGKAYRGAFNNTHGATLAGHVIEHAVQRARLDPAEVEDVVIGCAMPEGATGHNIARQAALRAGLPVTAAATTINRFCSSGLQAIAVAAQRVIVDGVPVAVAGGVESISLVQNEHQNRFRLTEDWLLEHKPEVYMSMLNTAEVVAKRYGVTREMQDRYALESQRRIAAAQKEGRLDAEIVPLKSVKLVADKATNETREESVTLAQDEGNRADTTADGLASLKPVVSADGTITAG